MPPSVCASLYRIAQEAITNAAKHAQARCVQLRLEAGPADIVLSVEDDGEATDEGCAPKPAWDFSACRSGWFRSAERCISSGGRPAAPGWSRPFPIWGRNHEQTRRQGFTRVMLADDHAIVREGYRSLLQKQDRLQVVAEAGNGAEAYRIYKEVKPDLVIMDVSMPGIGGVEAIRRIRQWDHSARILVFTMHQSAAYAVQAIKAGARGFVTKSNPPEALLRAIAEVMAGRIALSPDIDHELAISRLAGEPSAVDALSPREFEILRMLLAEKSVDDIAETLHISVKTAANTRYLIRAKLGVASDIELVRLALRQRIIAAEDMRATDQRLRIARLIRT